VKVQPVEEEVSEESTHLSLRQPDVLDVHANVTGDWLIPQILGERS